MIRKIIGFLSCLFIILNLTFTTIATEQISVSINTIYNDLEKSRCRGELWSTEDTCMRFVFLYSERLGLSVSIYRK